MADGKYDRSISMQCPTCGSEDFEHEESSPIVTCHGCGRAMTKDELKEANGPRIEAEIESVKAEAMRDVRKEFDRIFKKWK